MVDPNRSYILLFQYVYKKNLILNIYFESNYIFINHLSCFYTYQDDQIMSSQLFYNLIFFLLKNINNSLIFFLY